MWILVVLKFLLFVPDCILAKKPMKPNTCNNYNTCVQNTQLGDYTESLLNEIHQTILDCSSYYTKTFMNLIHH